MMMQPVELTFPVLGITGKEVETVEKALRKLSGVSRAEFDPSAGKVSVAYDPTRIDLHSLHQAVTDAGGTIPSTHLDIKVTGMSCMSCVAHVQNALEDLPGVFQADVKLSAGTARVSMIPELVSTQDLVNAVESAGYMASLMEISSSETSPDSTARALPGEPSGFAWKFKNLIRRK